MVSFSGLNDQGSDGAVFASKRTSMILPVTLVLASLAAIRWVVPSKPVSPH